MTRFRAAVLALVLACASGLALAGAADVIAATARQAADGSWSFEVAMRCDDRGADYFCDRFEVMTPTARVVGVRRLLHDHTDEQPFTRDLHGVHVRDGFSRGARAGSATQRITKNPFLSYQRKLVRLRAVLLGAARCR